MSNEVKHYSLDKTTPKKMDVTHHFLRLEFVFCYLEFRNTIIPCALYPPGRLLYGRHFRARLKTIYRR